MSQYDQRAEPKRQQAKAVKRAASSSATSAGTQVPRRRRAVQFVLVVVGLIVAANALVGDKGFLATLKARQEFRELEGAITTARADNARLREEARRLREDPAAIEEIARRELGFIRPGEKLFIVKDVRPKDRPKP